MLRHSSRSNALETVDLELERVLEEKLSYMELLSPFESDLPLDVSVFEWVLDQSFPEKNKNPEKTYGETMVWLDGAGP
jgi:hypothetical protein